MAIHHHPIPRIIEIQPSESLTREGYVKWRVTTSPGIVPVLLANREAHDEYKRASGSEEIFSCTTMEEYTSCHVDLQIDTIYMGLYYIYNSYKYVGVYDAARHFNSTYYPFFEIFGDKAKAVVKNMRHLAGSASLWVSITRFGYADDFKALEESLIVTADAPEPTGTVVGWVPDSDH